MKKICIIGCFAILIGGCNPNKIMEEKYEETNQVLADLLDECVQLARAGKTNEISELDRRDPWNTPIFVSLSEQSPQNTVIVVVAAGADCVHHTEDDVTETRAVWSK